MAQREKVENLGTVITLNRKEALELIAELSAQMAGIAIIRAGHVGNTTKITTLNSDGVEEKIVFVVVAKEIT